MDAISEKLNRIKTAKEDIKTSLENKGLAVDNNIETYASVIDEITLPVITSCRYLFYEGARQNCHEELLACCKNVTSIDYMYYNTYGAIKNARLPEGVVTSSSCNNVFTYCTATEEIDFTNFDGTNTTTFNACFSRCSALKKVLFDKNKQYTSFTTLSNMFNYGGSLLEVDLSCFVSQKLTEVYRMFNYCSKLPKIDLSPLYSAKITNSGQMFYYCSALTTVIIDNENVFPMTNVNMFTGTPIESGTGYVYVPDNLVDTYKTATNWSTYADQIKPLSEYVGE